MGKRYGEAIDLLTRALALKADDAVALRNRGYAYQQTGDNAAALKDFERSIELKGDEARTHLLLGIVAAASGTKTGAFAAIAA